MPPISRPWIDETQDFNMRTVRSTLRPANQALKDLRPDYTWYTDAVPVDAIFPPGISLSIKEILAYYPHHVRWREVEERLSRNDYTKGDVLEIQVSKTKDTAIIL
jgi:hypothetical protein